MDSKPTVKVEGKHAEIFQDRGKRYGDHVLGHEDLGLIWTGLLQNHYRQKLPHPIPPHIVELMMVANKMNRIAVNPAGRDHYADGHVYLSMCEDAADSEGHFKKDNGKDNV